MFAAILVNLCASRLWCRTVASVNHFRRGARLWVLSACLLLSSLIVGVGAATFGGGNETPTLSQCELLPHGFDATRCYVDALPFKTEAEFLALLANIEAMVKSSSWRHFKVECHEVTHEIGKLAAQRFPDYQKYYKTTPSIACMAGLQHGLLDTELAEVSDRELAQRGLSFCDGKLNHADRCTHLLGHISFLRMGTSDFEDRMGLVREVCGSRREHASVEAASLEFRCYDGAYMEASLRERRDAGGLGIGSDPLARCVARRETSPVEASACVYQLVQVAFRDGDAAGALAACERHLVELSRELYETCILGFTNFLGVLEPGSGQTPGEVCAGLGDYVPLCLAGFARSARNMAGYEAMREVCGVVDPSNYERCVDLAMRPLPVEYRYAGSLTNIAVEYSKTIQDPASFTDTSSP